MRRLTKVMGWVLALGSAGCAGTSDMLPRRYAVTPNEMLEVYGVYQMDNGETMRISRERRRYWAETRATGKVEIVPVADMVFETAQAAPEGRLRLVFTARAFATDVSVDWACAGKRRSD